MKVFDLFGQIDLKGIDKVNKQLGGLQTKLESVGKKFKTAGKGMTMAGGAMVGAVSAIAIPSLKMAADFDTAMREVNTMLLLNENEFQKLSDDTREMARVMGVDATEAAGALYQAISAGVPKENVIEFLEVASKAAIGGVTYKETAVDGLTTVINAFKLPMSEAQAISDAMFTTVAKGKTTFPELAANMSKAMPIAATLGIGYKDVLATVATLTKQGVHTAEAFTQIRASMVALTKPTKEMNDLIQASGYENSEAMLKTLGYAGTLDTLTKAAGGNKEILGKAFGSVEALGAVFGTTGENAEMAAADLDSVSDSAGSGQAAFEEMEKSTARQMAHLMADLKDTALTIGTTLLPILRQIMETVMPIIQKIGAWAKENPKLVKTILMVVGAVGGLLITLGPILMIIGSLLPMLPAIGGAFMALLGPVGLIIAGIAALIAIGVLVGKNWDTIKEKAIEIWNGICDFFSGIWNTAKEWGVNLVKGFWEGIQSMATWIWDKVTGFAKSIYENIKEGLGNLWPFSPSEAGVNIGKGLTEGIEVGVKKALGNVRSAMQDIGAEISVNTRGAAPKLVTPSATRATVTNEFNIAQLIVREEADVQKVARELFTLQQRRTRAVGG